MVDIKLPLWCDFCVEHWHTDAFGRRKVESIAIGYKGKPFLIVVNLLNHIEVCFIVLDEITDPRNLQKLVVIGEKKLKVETAFLQ